VDLGESRGGLMGDSQWVGDVGRRVEDEDWMGCWTRWCKVREANANQLPTSHTPTELYRCVQYSRLRLRPHHATMRDAIASHESP